MEQLQQPKTKNTVVDSNSSSDEQGEFVDKNESNLKSPELIKNDGQISDNLFTDLKQKNSVEWNKVGEKMSLDLFYKSAKEVPAYRDFLRKNNIEPTLIKTFEDFQKIPIVSKKNYLRHYKLKELHRNGKLNASMVFTSTSGSTGEPFYFSRQDAINWQYSLMHEFFLKNGDTKKTTLVIIGFGMGVWIGGMITFRAYEMIGLRKNYPLSLLPTGINKKEIFNALKNLAPNFDQTILIGYAPFIKDIVDEAPEMNIDLKKLNIRLAFAAEAFTENFRNYLAKKVNLKNPCIDTMNVYGTADIGAVAFETPLSILIRRLAVKKRALFKDIFSDIKKTPTLAQYFPNFVNIECIEGEILLTGNNSIPLVRYSVGDRGGIYSFDNLKTKLEKHGIDLDAEIKNAGISETVNYLPFVFVYERNDFSTTLYGVQIYPETIREILIKSPFDNFFTGKFTLMTKFDEKQNQYLEINLEQKKNKKTRKFIQLHLLRTIIKNLMEKNSEYRELHKFIQERSHPKLVLWSAEDPLHFKPGVKQVWVKK